MDFDAFISIFALILLDIISVIEGIVIDNVAKLLMGYAVQSQELFRCLSGFINTVLKMIR